MENGSSYEIFDSAIRLALKNYWNYPEWEDLYQECYLKILDVLSNNTYEPVYNLYGYAYKIARNAISTYMYHHKKLTTLVSEEFPDVPTTSDFEGGIILESSLIKTLNKYKASLPDGYTKEDLLKLLLEDSSDDALTNLIKGDLIWEISTYGK